MRLLFFGLVALISTISVVESSLKGATAPIDKQIEVFRQISAKRRQKLFITLKCDLNATSSDNQQIKWYKLNPESLAYLEHSNEIGAVANGTELRLRAKSASQGLYVCKNNATNAKPAQIVQLVSINGNCVFYIWKIVGVDLFV